MLMLMRRCAVTRRRVAMSVLRTIATVIACLGLSAPLLAATWQVDTETDAVDAMPGDGLCAIAGVGSCSLRAAIQEANSTADADEILIPAGVFALTVSGVDEDHGASGDLDVRSALTLRGAGAALSVIDGAALDRVLDVHAPAAAITVVLESLALSNGRSTQVLMTSAGMGLRVAANVNLQLQDVDVRDNQATHAFGGAVGIDNRGCLSGTRVRILRNIDPANIGAGHALAGAVATRGANSCFTLEDSEISGNVADKAGAIYADIGAPVTLRRTLVSDNTSRFAGAMTLNQANQVLLEDTTLSGNHGNPGGILIDGGAILTLRNCTVTANNASNSSAVVGGIHDVHGGFGRTFISNSIIAGNGPGFISDDCSNLTSTGGGNVIGSIGGCHASLLASDRTGIDPELGALADNGGFSRSHLPGAPVRDSAVDTICTALDQRGVARPQDGDGDGTAHCDAGAVESIAIPPLFADGFE
jgi:CSLREA domain-containing protein